MGLVVNSDAIDLGAKYLPQPEHDDERRQPDRR